MKKLKSVKFTQIDPTETYLYSVERYERFGSGDVNVFVATGDQIIKSLREIFFYEEWKEDFPQKFQTLTQKKFLSHCWDANGDCVEFVQIFKLPVSK